MKHISSLGLLAGFVSFGLPNVLADDYLVATNYHKLSKRQTAATKNITVVSAPPSAHNVGGRN